jgi:hypothetical protein
MWRGGLCPIGPTYTFSLMQDAVNGTMCVLPLRQALNAALTHACIPRQREVVSTLWLGLSCPARMCNNSTKVLLMQGRLADKQPEQPDVPFRVATDSPTGPDNKDRAPDCPTPPSPRFLLNETDGLENWKVILG